MHRVFLILFLLSFAIVPTRENKSLPLSLVAVCIMTTLFHNDDVERFGRPTLVFCFSSVLKNKTVRGKRKEIPAFCDFMLKIRHHLVHITTTTTSCLM